MSLLCHSLTQLRVTLKSVPRGATLEVWVKKMIVGGKVCGGHVVVLAGRIDPPEAVEVELADEAGEVGGFEGVGVAQGVGAGGQDLSLEELRVDDDGLAFAVPEDGPFRRVVYQTPQFSKEVFRIHAGRERPSTHVHASSLKNWKQSEA